MAILKEHAERTLRARIRRVNDLLIDATGTDREAGLVAYGAQLAGKLAELRAADAEGAHEIGMWCRDNHALHLELCPESVANMVKIDPRTGKVLSRPEPPAEPGPTQVIEVESIIAPSDVGTVESVLGQ